jgi:hypothetical protein
VFLLENVNMTRRGLLGIVCGGFVLALLPGCSGDSPGSSVSLAPTGGVVMFKGRPLAGASVSFVPEKGPIATGTTDLEGKFKLSTGGQSGAAIGNGKFTVSAYEGGAAPVSENMMPTSKEDEKKFQQMMMDKMKGSGTGSAAGGPAGPKSLIPERYSKEATSDLSFKVEKDASKNQFTLELKE